MKTKTRNFRKYFSVHEYLKEYYAEIGSENQALLEFIHKAYKKIGGPKRVLEIGGGPTIYHLLSASNYGNKIVFTDFLDRNLVEVKKWLENQPVAYDWDKFLNYVLKLEGKSQTRINRKHLKLRVINSILKLNFCDIRLKNPLFPQVYPPFDVVYIGGVTEAVASRDQEFKSYMSSITFLLKPGGWLLQFVCKNATFWRSGNAFFAGFPVNEVYMKNCLSKLGYRDIKICSVPNEYDQGYEGLIFITARLTNKH
ncbi:MAG TPA: guanitoxin biosynthesis pre-guanitoxin forming N-methyltransferase GntF [Candidatus Bathyarchaeia archaeon]|nr:guanitoxin biosynthesis pre-guanitoxin forming N-methyltransferase GntF [Candidatus Bathyarchaeia archaeon]